jgi:ribosomal protein S18 acetylase RimI-like enzyme
MNPAITDSVTLRPAQPEDESFLFELYRDTRAEEMALWGWSEAQQLAFLSMQFRARNLSYSTYKNTEHLIILYNGRTVGRLLVSRMEDEIRLVDIALLDEACGQGIGSKLIEELIAKATSEGKPLRLHVEKFNRAFQLYQRLGFQIIEDTGTQYLMERQN